MKIEHFAVNVNEPNKMAHWWADNLGLKIIREDDTPPYITFLADEDNGTVIELYANPKGAIVDFGQHSIFTFHIAFAVDDISAECNRLIAAGATSTGDIITMGNGDLLGFVRDPWGIVIQFLQRVEPLFK
ncbi:MAG: VOC family protein [Candidatus Promineifilaceae bacterium]